MAQYEEGQIEFAILSLVQDPLLRLIPTLAENAKSVAALSARLDSLEPDWQDFTTSPANGETTGLPDAPNPCYGLTQGILDHATLPQEAVKLCGSDVVQGIVEHRQRLITAQAELRMSISEELESDQTDEEKANARSRDYGARMQNVVRQVRAKKALSNSLDSPT